MNGIKDEYPVKPLPAFLPDALSYCNQANSEEELLNLLIQDTGNLLIFFEFMCEDETWSERHSHMICNLIEWLTVQGLYDKLTDDTYRRISCALRKHAVLFETCIPKNITIQLKDGVVTANSLLLTASAPFFKDAIRRERSENNSSKLVIPYVTCEVLNPILEFANTGFVKDLWKLPEYKIVAILRQAQSWGADPVIRECEEVLKRYITRENVFEWLVQADLEHWHYFKQLCVDFINRKELGFQLSLSAIDRLKAEFDDFSEDTLLDFQNVQGLVTDVACHGSASEHRGFVQVLKNLPRLVGVDLSRTTRFSDHFYSLPAGLSELNLSKCSWLSQSMLRKMGEICPRVKRLQLANNQQLNFAAWGELAKFKQLLALDLSECQQISNDDLSVILSAGRGVLEWNVSECKKLSESGFLEFSKKALHLTHLNLSRTQLSDTSLIELAVRCRYLRVLVALACSHLTVEGVAECVKHAPALQKLDIRLCRIPQAAVEELRFAYPYISILSGAEE
jgi:hypothetical protein